MGKPGRILVYLTFIVILLIALVELKNNLSHIKSMADLKKAKESTLAGQELKGSTEPQGTAAPDSFIIRSCNPIEGTAASSAKSAWRVIDRRDSYNEELQYYSKDNVFITDESITIIALKEEMDGKLYTSGLVESTCAYKYGYFEFAMKAPKGKGLFPAIWLLPESGSSFPEIDIFEMLGSEPDTFYGVIHFMDGYEKASDYFSYRVEPQDKYIVALRWEPDALTWYIDHKEVHKTTKGVPQEYMFLIINQAIGGIWPGSPDENTAFPSYFRILSIHIDSQFRKDRN